MTFNKCPECGKTLEVLAEAHGMKVTQMSCTPCQLFFARDNKTNVLTDNTAAYTNGFNLGR